MKYAASIIQIMKTLYDWLIKENLFKNFPNKQSRKSMTLGKKTTFTEEEQKSYNKFCRIGNIQIN